MKHLLVHIGGFNLGRLMRSLVGIGTPRGLQGRRAAVLTVVSALWTRLEPFGSDPGTPSADQAPVFTPPPSFVLLPVGASE